MIELFIWQEPGPGHWMCSLFSKLFVATKWQLDFWKACRKKPLRVYSVWKRSMYILFVCGVHGQLKISKLNMWLNTTCVAEANRDGGWETHTLHEQFSGKLQRAKRCNRFMKRILHEPQKILSLQPSLFALWDWRYNLVGSEPSSEGSVVMEFFLKLNAS